MNKILAAFVCALIIAGFFTKSYAEETQKNISNAVFRLHVIANSDGEVDQALKLKVRDGVLYSYFDVLSQSESVDKTKTYIAERLDEIEDTAESIVKAHGFDYNVTAMLASDYFPTNNYGDITLPAGMYDALRIEIGSGEGKNWWCVMFPPLCFVDVTKSTTIPDGEKSQLKAGTGEAGYALLSDEKREGDVVVSVKFKIVEWWQRILNKNKHRESRPADTKLVKADDIADEAADVEEYPDKSTSKDAPTGNNSKLSLPKKK
ncbi:MAG: stage II sporulation protein R [Clostridiales bacterium]|nr:stage II sporulation protein R [Clostridiales bacterium]